MGATFIETQKVKNVMEHMLNLCGRLVGQQNKENYGKTTEELDEEDDISYFMDGDLAPKEQRERDFSNWCAKKLGNKRKMKTFKIVEDDESDSSHLKSP